MSEVEKRPWNAFVAVVKGFLVNTKAANYKNLVETLLDSFHVLGCNIKVHFLKRHLNKFPANLGDVSDEQTRQVFPHTMANYCWSDQRDCVNMKHTRRSCNRKFVP